MQGLMMNMPLTITSIMRHAEKVFPNVEIVSVTHDNPRHRYTYREAFTRVRQLAQALKQLGVKSNDCIGTLAWNDYRHFEIYYAVSCSGMICHTINPRLFGDQVNYIINHAEDKWLFIDPGFLPLIEQLHPQLGGVKGYVILTDEEHMPDTSLPNAYCYESLLAPQETSFNWPDLDEGRASGICYTSGTTGNPKGVMYSHRSTVLHCYASVMPDAFGLSVRDVLMPVVPMFHVNAWGCPYSAAIVGAKLVMPGGKMGDGETLQALIEEEGVTVSAGVPTVWLALLKYLQDSDKKVESLKKVLVGGSACPFTIVEEFKNKHDVHVQAAWGMTETSPVGALNVFSPDMDGLSQEEKQALIVKPGRPLFGIELKIVDAENHELPWDGKAYGSLKVRGPWVSSSYLKLDNSPAYDDDGWFETGDVATIDQNGFMQVTDRTKDVIKSGGEWISSIELENVAVDHPEIAEAAVIGIPHPKWSERPMLVAVKVSGAEVTEEDMIAWYEGKVAKWCIPDSVLFINELPHTATGKLHKLTLRDWYKAGKLNKI